MKRTVTRISAWLLTLLLIFSLTACAPKMSLVVTDAGTDISLLPPEEAQFMADPDVNRVNRYGRGIKELSHPTPVTLSWTVEEGNPASYQVAVSENSDMSDAWVYETTELSLDVYNCKIGTTYYWTVSAVSEKGKL